MASIVKACVVCGKGRSSYKCPKCLAPYCSKDCCSAHKNICDTAKVQEKHSSNVLATTKESDNGGEVLSSACEYPLLEGEASTVNTDDIDMFLFPSATTNAVQTNTDVESSTPNQVQKESSNNGNEVLSDKQKDLLLNNAELLKSLLKSKRLRDDIALIDSSADRVTALRSMRAKNAEFNEVMEKILNIIHEGQVVENA